MIRKAGEYKSIGEVEYYIPYPLPPKNPELQMTPKLIELHGEASFRLGQLNARAAELPDPNRFIKAYVIKEALISSSIEGIHTTLADVYSQALPDAKLTKPTELVLNYTNALNMSIKMITQEGLPISNRVILGAHKALMSLCNEDHSNPGHFRKQPVRVGPLTPAPAQEVPPLMHDLELYINSGRDWASLMKAGLAHVQFETIHPFLDGNGRVGRMLIVLMLIKEGLLSIPILYLSYYFKRYHEEYYQNLNRVRTEGDYEGWLAYYFRAIRESSFDAYRRIKDIEKLEQDVIVEIRKDAALSKMGEAPYVALDILFSSPVINVTELSIRLEKSYNTAAKIVDQFMLIGVLEKVTEQKRSKLFRFESYMKLLSHTYTPED